MQPVLPRDSDSNKKKLIDSSGYLSTKTIVALCTPTGGAIAMIRISGEDAFSIFEKLTEKKVHPEEHRKAAKTWIKDESRKIDELVYVPYFSPRSFTGENVVELFLHGSPIISQRVLDLVFKYGGRQALPGEFSFRAVKNGKIDLSQAEAIKEIISAENDFALDMAMEKLSGSQHALVEKIRNELTQLVTLSEVALDFSDQDIEEVSLPRLKQRTQSIIEILNHLEGSFDRGKRFTDGIPVSLFGLPNAGKSSFFNALLGEDRSIVSEIAGTTRDVIREKLNLKGDQGYVTFKLSDTAGIRGLSLKDDHEKIEEVGIKRSIEAAKKSDLVLLVVDGLNPETNILKKFLFEIPDQTIIGVITKKDLLNPSQQEQLFIHLKNDLPEIKDWAMVSSMNLEGVSMVVKKMTVFAERFLIRKPGEVLITHVEQLTAVRRAIKSLNEAMGADDSVLFATCLRHSMGDLGALIGETIPDDILGKIFSDFCIGK